MLLYLLQRLQPLLPLSLGPRRRSTRAMAFNTAVSFVTNTNWQSYVPETVMGHPVQMAGLTVQNFVSAAVGMAVAVALIRGFVRAGTDRIGNFWVDLTRGVTRVLLPISFVAAIVLVALGVMMSLRVRGGRHRCGRSAVHDRAGPGRVPGGDQGARHQRRRHLQRQLGAPVREPERADQPARDLPAAGDPGLPDPHVRHDGRQRPAGPRAARGDGRAVGRRCSRSPGGPRRTRTARPPLAAGAAMEGKEVRFGIPGSVLFAVSTTGTSTGAVNSLHDSYTGLGGGVTLLNMLLGEIAPGGVGTGLYGILVLAIIAVFLAGLMVGRTPEYLGKKLGRARGDRRGDLDAGHADGGAARRRRGAGPCRPSWHAALANAGAHGLSEVLYAYASAGNNNGSAFAGLTVTSDFFQSTLGAGHAVRPVRADPGRARAGRLAGRAEAGRARAPAPCRPPARCSAVLVGGTVVLVAALTFFPALALGPDRGGPGMTHPDHSTGRIVDAPRPHAERTGRTVAAGVFSPRQLLAGAARRAAQARPARTSCATRSCSWSGSARCWSPCWPSPSPSVFAMADRGLAVVHRAVREPGRGGRRGPRQGAGRDAAPHRNARRWPAG